jgi:hypothetical protein
MQRKKFDMKHFGLMLIMIFAFTACGPAPTPAPTPDINATIAALSNTMLAGTLTAQPTKTPVPTETLSPTATPTMLVSETPTLELATSVPSPTTGPSATPWTGFFDPGNTNDLPTGLLRIENLSGEKEITVTLNGITLSRDQPVYYAYKVTGAFNIDVKWARYSYVIQIPNKRTITGTFGIASKDKTTMKIYLTKVVVAGP